MNSKGSFAAIVAVSLLVLISAIGFTYYANGFSQKALLESQDALELRQHFTQVRYLLDKAAAKALLGSGDSVCNSNTTLFTSNIKSEFQAVLDATNSSLNCSIPYLASIIASDNTAFSTTIECSAKGVFYSSTASFKKDLRGSAAPCEVWDTQGSPEFKDI